MEAHVSGAMEMSMLPARDITLCVVCQLARMAGVFIPSSCARGKAGPSKHRPRLRLRVPLSIPSHPQPPWFPTPRILMLKKQNFIFNADKN